MAHRRFLLRALSLFLALALATSFIPPARAFPVVDAAHIIETVLAAAQRYEQLAESLGHQIQNLERVEEWFLREILDYLTGFENVQRYKEALVYADQSTLEDRWFETFQSFETINDVFNPEGADGLDQLRQRRTLETLWGLMRAVRLQATNVTSGQQLLEDVKVAATTAGGNLDSAQVDLMIGAYEAEELAQLRQVLAAQTNLQLVTRAAEYASRAQTGEELIVWLGLRDPAPPVGDFTAIPLSPP